MWDDARQLNAIAVTLTSIAISFVAWAIVGWVTRLSTFDYREVVVTTPLARTSAAHLESVIRGELRGTFFTLDLDAARTSLSRVPFVRAIALRRQWPHRLEIEVDEHEPLARWNSGALVNTRGEVFVANWAGELPEFHGPDGRSAAMTERFREWSALLAPLALRLRGLNLSARGGWQLQTVDAGGALTLDVGRDDVSARLARFVAVHARTVGVLARTGKRIDHVDLRHHNGFAARMPAFREKASRKVAVADDKDHAATKARAVAGAIVEPQPSPAGSTTGES